MQISSEALHRTGRSFIGILFLCAGIIKITHVPMFLSYMASGELPFVSVPVRENTAGQTLVAYHPAAAITEAVILTNEQLAGFSRVEALIADTVMRK